MQLSTLCDIQSGYTARRALSPATGGGVPAIQLRDVPADGSSLSYPLQRFDLGGLADRYFVRGGEVLFRSRGEPSTAVAVDSNLAEAAVVILPLLILRPKNTRILPEYLAWFINHPVTQRRLTTEARGTNLRMIPRTAIDTLEIALPDVATQSRIVELHRLSRQEGELLRSLAERREQLSSIILAERARVSHQKDTAR